MRRRWLWSPAQRKARRRLRAGYRGALKQREREMQAKIDKAKDEAALAIKMARTDAQRSIAELDRRVAQLASEIVRVKLEYSPMEFGQRFTLYARMAETFVLHARDLKELASFVIPRLSKMIEMEFAQIDWTRQQPVAWDWEVKGRGPLPTYRIEPNLERPL